MNEMTLSSPDVLIILAALVVSFVLGGIYRLGRNAAREMNAVDLTEHDIRSITERYDDQQRNVTRLNKELDDVRQALMQQAMAMGPVHAAMRMPVTQAPMAVATPMATPVVAPMAMADAAAAVARSQSRSQPESQSQPQSQPQSQATAQSQSVATPQPAARPQPVETAPAGPVAASAAPQAATATTTPAAGNQAGQAKPRKPARPVRHPMPLELARAGASAQVLMKRFGLSRAEADLVVSVHGKPAAPTAA